MKKLDSLSRNIINTLLVLFLCQSFLFIVIQITTKIPLLSAIFYYPVSFGFHLFLLYGLFKLKNYFFLVSTGEALKKINLANIITLVRMSAIPSIFFLLLFVRIPGIKWILIIYISFVFITDFVDGILARSMNQITGIGKYIDSSGDYMILFFSSIVYLYYSLIPLWLFILIVIRIFSIGMTAIILYFIKNGVVYAISFLGKVSIFALMTLLSVKLLPLFGVNNAVFTVILTIIEYVTGALLAISFVERLYLLKKALDEK